LNLASPAVPDNVLASPVSGETVETEPVLSKPMSMIQIIPRIHKGRQIVAEKGAKSIISEGIHPSTQKKVKSRRPRDEIDDIFSFTK